MQKTIYTVGHIAYDTTKISAVNLKFSGWIERLYVAYVGQFVEQGQPLFEIYSPELVATQEAYLQAVRAFPAERTAEPGSHQLKKHARDRLRLWGITEKQMTQLASAGAPLLRIAIHSPVGGYVVVKNVVEGGYVSAGTDLYTIADFSTVWVYADIYEHELPFVQSGQQARLRLSYAPGIRYTGHVDYIYPALEARTRIAKLRLIFSNSDLLLKPDMYVDVEIEAEQGEQPVVPETAVLNTGVRRLVFVARGNGQFEPRGIDIGAKVGHAFVVLSGLREGEIVVKSGNFLIGAEAHVQGALQGMGR